MKEKFAWVGYLTPIPNWNEIVEKIDPKDIYVDELNGVKGKEVEPHVTVLYGLHDSIEDKELFKFLLNWNPISLEITGVSCFENQKNDVLKFDISCDKLHEYHNSLKKNFDYTNNYPKFNPHITIAYLKKGAGTKYDFSNHIGKKINCNELKYGKINKDKFYMKII